MLNFSVNLILTSWAYGELKEKEQQTDRSGKNVTNSARKK